MAKATVTTETIAARDGYELSATLYAPGEGEVERIVVVSAAMGLKQSFYEPYARYLAGNGCAAVTWDYRGMGKSLKGSVAKSDATIGDWGSKDYPAVIEWAKKKYPGKKLHIVGHSMGGQLVGVLDNVDEIDSVLTIAVNHGYHRLYPFKESFTYGLLFWILMPLLSILLGYFPSRKFGLGESFPKGVALEWARFCRSPHYIVTPDGEPLRTGFDKYAGPMRAYDFGDDKTAPDKNVRAIHAYFSKTTVDHRHVEPKEVGGRIGHVGFFLAKYKDSLWSESLEWLRKHPG